MLEEALKGVVSQTEEETDPRLRERLTHQKQQVQQELSKVRQQLAGKSKVYYNTRSMHSTNLIYTLML